jgi:sec-independent protein translocase protein TatC
MPQRKARTPNETRMTVGEHLEELRRRLLIGLAGVVIGVIVCLSFAGRVFQFICQPVFVVLQRHGQDAHLQALSPEEPFVLYLRIGLICGLIVSCPWLIWQIWQFVAAGLYPRERRWVQVFAPASIGLFALGVAFMFYVILPIVLNYLVAFGRFFPYPTGEPTLVQRILLPQPKTRPTTTTNPSAPIPLLDRDPPHARPGELWFNTQQNELRCQTADGVRAVPSTLVEKRTPITNQFRLREYVRFVLMLSLGFGVAFQVPLVVIFLSLLGIVRVERIAAARRYVILIIVILAAVLTPPDLGSQILLAVPMILLFETGLLVSRLLQRRAASDRGPASA